MSSTQTSLTDVVDSSDESASLEISLESQLNSLDLNSQTVGSLIETFDSKSDIINSKDKELLSVESVGETTVETIRCEWDDSVGDDYTIVKSHSGGVKSEWTEKADITTDLIAGGLIIESLTDHYDTIDDLQEDLDNWAHNYRNASTVADELLEAISNLTDDELNSATLYDTDPTTTGNPPESDLDPYKQQALFKARGLMAFCSLTDKRNVYTSAYSTAETTVAEARQRKEKEDRKRKRARNFLNYPRSEIGNWVQINHGLAGIRSITMAYRGIYNDIPSVICLYRDEDEGQLRVDGFRLVDWMHADQDPTEIDPHFSVDKGSTQKEQAAWSLRSFLKENDCEEPLSPPRIDYNGWYVTETGEDLLTYEDPTQGAQITAEDAHLTLRADGEQQTVEMDSQHRAKRNLISYLHANPAIAEGGDPVSVPIPDEQAFEDEANEHDQPTVPLEDHPAVADVNIAAMELTTNAEGWNDFPHPDEIRCHLPNMDDLKHDLSLPSEVKEAVDELTEDPSPGDFLIMDAHEVYNYLETLQYQSDLHLENFHRRQLIVDTLADNQTLSTYDKRWIVDWEVRRRLAERENLDGWGQKYEHKLSKDNRGLPNSE